MNPHIRTLNDLRTNPMVPAALTPIPEDDIAKVAQSMSSWTSHTMSFPLKIPDDSLEDSGDEQQSSSDNGTVVLSNGMCFSGGYGDVWLGRLEDGLKRRSASFQVAVKIARPPPEYAMKSQPLPESSCLRREIVAWKKLQHENIVPLLGIIKDFSPYTCPGLVSPWMKNGNITDFQRTKHLTVQTRLQILCDVAAGLEYLHSQEIIHGDLTGNNVLIDENQKACLTGFGMFAVKSEHEGACYWSSTIGGGMRYRAPELLPPLEGDMFDFKPVVTQSCDIYSMGSVILQLLSGTVPYKEIRSDVYVLLTLAHGIRPRRPKTLILTDKLWAYIEVCWGKSADERPLAGEVTKAMKDFLDPIGPSIGASEHCLPVESP
ncbi:kinase-like protein [Athelia psychrophila]|uniref:Kinase-like protein n=1 Tax=Athelia psychrophila TaxID=1759441 RepID=A0A165WP19_9AGAM|nr:kinase-like protein [Fibularhizoctonia sp. CBS 109695]